MHVGLEEGASKNNDSVNLGGAQCRIFGIVSGHRQG
jgi:hypothetical protein